MAKNEFEELTSLCVNMLIRNCLTQDQTSDMLMNELLLTLITLIAGTSQAAAH